VEAEVESFTPGAFTRDLRYGLGKLRELRRFPRAAVVTSRGWVRWAARIEDAILPQIEVRVFSPSKRQDALAWVSQPLPSVHAEPAPAEPPVTIIRGLGA
jgi:hypothetical protein